MENKLYCFLWMISLTNFYMFVEGKDSVDGGVERFGRISFMHENVCLHFDTDSTNVSESRTRSERTGACPMNNARLDVYLCVCLTIVVWTTLTGISLSYLVLKRHLVLKRYQAKNECKTCCKPCSEEFTSVNDESLPTFSLNDSGDKIADKEYDKSRLECHNCTKSPGNGVNNAALPASIQLCSDDSPKADENEVSTRMKMIEDIQEMKERSGCKICLNACMNIVFLPCNHMVACENCSMFLDSCPVCRCRVKGSLQVQNSI